MLAEIGHDLAVLQLVEHVELLCCRDTLAVTPHHHPYTPTNALHILELLILIDEVFGLALLDELLTQG